MTDLAVTVGKLALANPVIAASGTFGFGEPFSGLVDVNALGGVIGKSIGVRERAGNPPPRTVETPSGMLNAIGLEGRGIDYFLKEVTPWLERLTTRRIVSIFGDTPEDYLTLARTLAGVPCFEALEVNLSCPNVKEGGLEFGHDPLWVGRITESCRSVFARPLWVKLSPNVTSARPFIEAAEKAGADAVTISNSYVGMAVDWRRRRPVLGNGTGGLTGPAIKPLALLAVHRAAQATRLPIIASGGASSPEDILEFLVAGASAVQIGTWNFYEPRAGRIAVDGIRKLLEKEGIAGASTLTRSLQRPPPKDPEPA